MREVLVDAKNLKKYFPTGDKDKPVKAVDDVSFQIFRGETLGGYPASIWKRLDRNQGVFFETYHFITGACGLTGRSGKFIHTPFLPENRPHIFRRTSNGPRKQTQSL